MAEDPTARALRLLGLLQAHRFWRGAELAERLDVTERTVRRDVDRLRRLGYPVDASPGAEGGYRLAPGSHVPPLVVDDAEAIALVIGLQGAAVGAIAGIDEASIRVLTKLEAVLPDRLRRRVAAVRHSTDVLAWTPPTEEMVDPDALVVLSDGCRAAEEVRFAYRAADGTDTRRLVEPHHLVVVGRRWYLVAWDLRRDDWRTFRVDRAENVTLAGRRFRRRALPGEVEPAEFVATRLRSERAEDFRADLIAAAPIEDVRARLGWLGAGLEETLDERTAVHLSVDSEERLATAVIVIAATFDTEIRDLPESTLPLVVEGSRRLAKIGDGDTP